jgi:hypothetical protein
LGKKENIMKELLESIKGMILDNSSVITIITQVIMVVVGIVTIIVNICISIYNRGKNRTIYDVEEIHVDRTLSKDSLLKLKEKLNKAEYTILNVFQNDVKKTTLYTLGKIKNKK